MRIQRVTIAISGLEGERAALAVECALVETAGVLRAYVNVATEMVYVEYNPCFARPCDLVAAVVRAGLEAGEPSPR